MKPLNKLLKLNTEDLIEFLYYEYTIEIPDSITSVEDMQLAGTLLSTLINTYSYLSSVAMHCKNIARISKGKVEKEEYNELIGKRDAIVQAAENAKMQYNALSRMITVKQEINNELKMSEYRYES